MSHLVSLGAGVLIGVVATVATSSPSVPETKVVTVEIPKVYTHKEVEEKIVVKPLPESCEDMTDEFGFVSDAANRLHNRGREIFRRVNGIDLAQLTDNTAGAKFEEWLNKQNVGNSTDLHTVFEYVQTMERSLQTCKTDIQRSADGDDVEPADGLPATRVY
jgi:hypothetical protein